MESDEPDEHLLRPGPSEAELCSQCGRVLVGGRYRAARGVFCVQCWEQIGERTRTALVIYKGRKGPLPAHPLQPGTTSGQSEKPTT